MTAATRRHSAAAGRWAALGVTAALAGWMLGGAGLPSSYLLGSLLLGLAVALSSPDRMAMPQRAFVVAQAALGVEIGAYLNMDGLVDLGSDLLPVALVTLGTVALGIAIGAALTRSTGLDIATSTLGMVAGGGSAIVSMADEFGGDERIVAFMQYLRVLVVITFTPLLVVLALSSPASGRVLGGEGAALGMPRDWLLVISVAGLGCLGGRMLRLSAPALLGPLALSGILTATPLDFNVPPAIVAFAFCVIGLRVGLRFTMDAIYSVRRLLGPVVLSLVVLLIACFAFAVLLDLASSATLLDAYLATTPGGVFAVTAAAFDTGADAGFVISVQGLRLLAMLLLAPAAVRLALAVHGRTRHREPRQPASTPPAIVEERARCANATEWDRQSSPRRGPPSIRSVHDAARRSATTVRPSGMVPAEYRRHPRNRRRSKRRWLRLDSWPTPDCLKDDVRWLMVRIRSRRHPRRPPL